MSPPAKTRLTLTFLVAPTLSCTSQTQTPELQPAQTQTSLTQEVSTSYQAADSTLSSVYQQVLTEYAADQEFVRKLRLVQQAWIAFRDAEFEAKFPAEDKQATYGSTYAMCASAFLKEASEERTEDLRLWLRGSEEGDVCRGSVNSSPGSL